jgi:hypothetical protein
MLMTTIVRATIAAAAIAAAGTGSAWSADRAVPVTVPGAAGDLGMGFGPAWIDGPSNGRFWQYNALARGSFALGSRWNLEGEANAKAFLVTRAGLAGGFPFQADGYVHLWARHASNSAWGIFAGGTPFQAVFVSVGGEFKHYQARSSFGAAAAFTSASSAGTTETGWTLNASANLYLNPNHRIGVSAAMMTGFPFSDGNPWQVTADFEHRSAALPASLWLSATRMHTVNGNAWVALGGFRIFIDRPGSTLQSHERDVPWTFVTPQLFTTGITG